ncbi:ABC transporter ATP-binding protein [Paracoccus sp. (in: a-proteobacteria)]|uniref:ABC transporter ATP-binding protein n=1 Tax=Paracoccus sp. TaxID=267 RepID=UPI0026DEE2FE|nr:ATP-binding cassette domain-containing protein [Paracoccus sp. (in: a-proteobacteria)]MDO5648185.1 ATP-binding cassette domain-containing protein [Paracoccus sp. (in: a-proteobacteria)]
MLEFDNVSKSFWTGKQRKVILAGASFRVELGQSLGILAPNGTGKTTLVNMMCGLEKPDEGEIRRDCRVSFPLGFMGGVVNKLSANENARYIARIYGLDPDYVAAFTRWLTNIDEYYDMPVGTYSAGMRQRFTFSLLLALDFDIYLIDEGMPQTTDVEFNRRAGQVLFDRLKGATTVIVSHQPQTLEKLCQRAAVMRDGKLFMFETLDEAKQYYDYTAQSAPL